MHEYKDGKRFSIAMFGELIVGKVVAVPPSGDPSDSFCANCACMASATQVAEVIRYGFTENDHAVIYECPVCQELSAVYFTLPCMSEYEINEVISI